MKEIAINTQGYRVLTPTGYQDFAGVAHMGDKPVWRIEFENGIHLETTGYHKLFDLEGNIVFSCDLKTGDTVMAQEGKTIKVKSVLDTGRVEPVYDLIDVQAGHRYYTNGILSHNCSFVSDDETLIEPMTLSRMKNYEPEFYTGQIRWYKEPQPNKTYLVGLDPCLGTGGDSSAIQVFELPGMIQVAEWEHNKTPPREQVRMLMRILQMIDQELKAHPDQMGDPTIYWTVENNTLGEAVLIVIEDTGEHMFPGTFISEKRRPGAARRYRKGLNTDNRKKLGACAKFKSLIESDRMQISSRGLIKQMKSFVSSGGSYAAKQGEKDDLIMATMLIVRMLETVVNWLSTEQAQELNDAIDPDDIFDQAMPVIIG